MSVYVLERMITRNAVDALWHARNVDHVIITKIYPFQRMKTVLFRLMHVNVSFETCIYL